MKKNDLKRRIRKYSSIILGVLCLSLCGMELQAQDYNVTGKIIGADDGLSIPGVSVIIKGTNTGTITNLDGVYNIKASAGQVLKFSFIGMEVQEKTVTGTTINVTMKGENIALNEVVAVGYGSQKKKEVTGAVVQVKSDVLTKMATADLGSSLQGQVAGVNVQASSGAPGSESNIQIRGVSSINGANAPLFVVDGIPQEGDPRLSSNEIESVDILKDAASAAIYGTRGAGGVILITTKKGVAGEMKITADSYYGIQKITSGVPLMNLEEWLYANQTYAANNTGTNPDKYWSPLATTPENFTNNTNLMDVLQVDNASIQNHSVNISGGKQDLTYSIVGSYFAQEGTLINTNYDRFNMRGNTSYDKGRWSVKTGMGFRVEEQSYAPWQLLLEAYKYKPFQPAIDPNLDLIPNAGAGGSNEAQNMSAMMAKLKQSDIRNGNAFNSNIVVNYEILKGLNFSTRLGADYNNNTRVLINPRFYIYDALGNEVRNSSTQSGVKNTSDEFRKFTWESGITYSKSFKEHQIKVLALASTEDIQSSSFWASRKDLVNNEVVVLDGATTQPGAGSSDKDFVHTITGLLGRVQYNYKSRYLLSVSARRDASSRFSEEYRSEIFPSVSIGWNVSDEPFWAPISNIVNNCKLRFGDGTVGNENVGDYKYAPTIELGYDAAFGTETDNTLSLGGIQTEYVNRKIKWETSHQQNLGIDLGFMDNRLTFTADFYNTNKVDMLFPLLLPTSSGAGQNSNVILNIGDMNNKGMEFALGYRQSGRFEWGVSTTYSKNVNKVTKMSETNKFSYFANGTAVDGISDNNDRITAVREGYEAGAYFVMETNGIVNTEEKLAEFQKIVSTAKMGDLIYVDNSGDGKINEDDRVYGGSGTPDYEVGLNANCGFKGFDLSMQWYASVGNEVINGSKIYANVSGLHKDLLGTWSENNPYGPLPAQRTGSHLNYRGWADIWVEDGSFIRLRNVTLGYTIPKSIIRKAGISHLRVYLATDNPLTLTKYTGYDPEVGNDGLATRGLDKGNYPISSQYRAGIQLAF